MAMTDSEHMLTPYASCRPQYDEPEMYDSARTSKSATLLQAQAATSGSSSANTADDSCTASPYSSENRTLSFKARMSASHGP